MHKFLLSVLVFFSIFSCKKENHVRPNLPQFTCDDYSDDGRFEAWDEHERALLLPDKHTTYNIRDTMASGYIKSLDMLTTHLSIKEPTIVFKVIYDAAADWSWRFQLIDNATGNIEAFRALYQRGGIENDTATERVELFSKNGITRGCKRLYYYGAIEKGADTTRAMSSLIVHSDLLFKGHYDLVFN